MKLNPSLFSLLAAASVAFAPTIFAAPPAAQSTGTVDVKTGATVLKFAAPFEAALTANSVTLTKVIPGKINTGKGELSFPITGGVFDLANLEGEFAHSGGFSLTKGDATVSVTDLVLDTPESGDVETLPTLSALVTVNGSFQGRINLLSVSLTGLTAPFSLPSNKKVVLSNATLTLTAEGAAALNAAFAVESFTPETVLGTATVNAIVVKGSL